MASAELRWCGGPHRNMLGLGHAVLGSDHAFFADPFQ